MKNKKVLVLLRGSGKTEMIIDFLNEHLPCGIDEIVSEMPEVKPIMTCKQENHSRGKGVKRQRKFDRGW